MTQRTVAIIQARMSSSRLPGKVLKDIAGAPMLERVFERTRRAARVDETVLATTTDSSDDPIAAFCKRKGYPIFRGSLHDVLDRYYHTARHFDADIIVRITADCPVIDPALIDETISQREAHHADFAANRLPPPWGRTYPIGLDVEVCTFAALERAWNEAKETFQREHVMPYLYEGVTLPPPKPPAPSAGISPRGFHILLLHHAPDYGALRWTVDTPEDLTFIREIYARFDGQDHFSWKDLLALVQREPELSAINAKVRHKTLREVDERAAKAETL